MAMNGGPGLLSGVKVVDFSILAAGPLTSKMLADYGAQVILVESETHIRVSGAGRQAGPPGTSQVNTSYFHNKFNTNKMSVTINLRTAEGKAVIRELLAVSDVFLANRTPRVLEQFDLTYDKVREVAPNIVYIAMPTMGAGGPRHFYGGHSWGIQAMAGLNMISGYADRMPTSPSPWSNPDVSCNPLHAVISILAALRYRRRTGRGQQIELAQYESTLCWTGPAMLQYTVNGTLMGRTENRHPGAAPHDVFRCRGDDSWCAICVFTDAQWVALCQAMGQPQLAEKLAYATQSDRAANETALRDIVEQWTQEQDATQVMERLQKAGVPCARLNNLEDLLRSDPQLRERQVWTEVEHPEMIGGKALVEGWGFRLSKVDPVPPRRAPVLGEHNDHVFQDVLGMPEERVNDLLVEGVLR
jgi:benzylsuccinate CoA-transferase BbsF subunit